MDQYDSDIISRRLLVDVEDNRITVKDHYETLNILRILGSGIATTIDIVRSTQETIYDGTKFRWEFKICNRSEQNTTVFTAKTKGDDILVDRRGAVGLTHSIYQFWKQAQNHGELGQVQIQILCSVETGNSQGTTDCKHGLNPICDIQLCLLGILDNVETFERRGVAWSHMDQEVR